MVIKFCPFTKFQECPVLVLTPVWVIEIIVENDDGAGNEILFQKFKDISSRFIKITVDVDKGDGLPGLTGKE